ncbi:MAG: hypothetical protein JWO67_5301 [Streptosporangiaceae bacterium]|nr:hypothetical protein [Streptosporangiaceae bacterium]
MGRDVWIAVIRVVLLLTAEPLARGGEVSGAALLGDMEAPFPDMSDPLLTWMLRLTRLSVMGSGLLT